MINDIKKIVYSLHHLQRKILPEIYLKDLNKISEKTGMDISVVNTEIQLLEKAGFVKYIKKEEDFIVLDKFGEIFVDNDLPEIKFLKEIEQNQKKRDELDLSNEEFSSAIGILKKEKLIKVDKIKNELYFKITEAGLNYLKNNNENPLKEFLTPILIENLTERQKEILEKFKFRRGFLKKITRKSFSAELTEKGKIVAEEIMKKYKNLDLIETLTYDMLKNKSYIGKEFRYYDISVEPGFYQIGRRHPMMEANNILRDIFLQMGFKEMIGPMVESAFWNMDALWIPQDHPARDEQDTFYLDGEGEIPKEYFERVKEMHENGIKKSHTPKGEFSQLISKRLLLRTHSTATSFRTLYKLSKLYKQGVDINGKYFYIANNFRNEAIDATHLAEFFQGEGFIIGENLSLADLMGFIKEYLSKLGFEKVKFKPTFNPYTEPSMEAHIYDKKLKKWYALINSGIFREETLRPLGLESKTIIAWGFGASRIATLLSGKTSMRDITGTTCDFKWLMERPVMKKKVRGLN